MNKKTDCNFEIISSEEMKFVCGGENVKADGNCVCSCNTSIGTWFTDKCDNLGASYYAPNFCGGDGMATCGPVVK